MRAFAILAVCACLVAISVDANTDKDRKKDHHERKLFNIPLNARGKTDYPVNKTMEQFLGPETTAHYYMYETTEQYDVPQPTDSISLDFDDNDLVFSKISDLADELGTDLCRNHDIFLGFQCGEYCMTIEWLCDGVGDCDTFDDESELVCSTRQEVEAIVDFCLETFGECGSGYPAESVFECVIDIDISEGMTYISRIYPDQLCDSNADCIDGSDEYGCGTFCACDDVTSVPCEDMCDGVQNCPNGEDESRCQHTCTMGCLIEEYDFMDDSYYEIMGVIPCDWECDGVNDCKYGEDESEVTCGPRYFLCPLDEFSCAEYPWSYMCDGYVDCYQGSDEEFCGDENSTYIWNYKKDEKKETKESLKKSGRIRRYDDVPYRQEQQAKRSSGKRSSGIVFGKKENLPKERHYMKIGKEAAKIRDMRKGNRVDKRGSQM